MFDRLRSILRPRSFQFRLFEAFVDRGGVELLAPYLGSLKVPLDAKNACRIFVVELLNGWAKACGSASTLMATRLEEDLAYQAARRTSRRDTKLTLLAMRQRSRRDFEERLYKNEGGQDGRGQAEPAAGQPAPPKAGPPA